MKLCELCNERKATVGIQQIIDSGKNITHYICTMCANSLGLNGENDNVSALEKLFFTLEEKKLKYSDDLICFSCGTKLNTILKSNHLGCVDCIMYFKVAILDRLRSKYSIASYTGKQPKQFVILNKPEFSQTITQLRIQLDSAIQNENFELAAYLRDKIKEELKLHERT